MEREAEDTVAQWLSEIGIETSSESETEKQNETPISITIGDEMLEGVIYDTALAAEFREKFPLTVSMAIFYAQTDNPDLTMEVIPVGRVTLDLSVFEELPGNVDITFELAE